MTDKDDPGGQRRRWFQRPRPGPSGSPGPGGSATRSERRVAPTWDDDELWDDEPAAAPPPRRADQRGQDGWTDDPWADDPWAEPTAPSTRPRGAAMPATADGGGTPGERRRSGVAGDSHPGVRGGAPAHPGHAPAGRRPSGTSVRLDPAPHRGRRRHRHPGRLARGPRRDRRRRREPPLLHRG